MSAPQWKGLFEWTMQHMDGTRIADMSQTTIDPEKMAWLQNVLQNYIKDLVVRLKEIKTALEEPENEPTNLEQQEALLDELQSIVEDLDQAKNLHLIGGVPLLMDFLQSPQGSLRWRAAEIVATCVQNNQEVQKAFFEDGILPLVLPMTSDSDDTCRLKAWMAVSCLIRNFQPAFDAFLAADGFEQLLRTVNGENSRLVKRGLFLLQYVLTQHCSGHIDIMKEAQLFAQLVENLDSDDVDVREKTFAVLLATVRSPEGQSLLSQDEKLKDKLNAMERKLDFLSTQEKEDQSSEIELLTELMTALRK